MRKNEKEVDRWIVGSKFMFYRVMSMPMDRKRYQKNWDAIAHQIKEAANWTCQKCDRPCRRPGETWEELESRLGIWNIDLLDKNSGDLQILRFNRFTLTVAHLNHIPEDCRPENLRAWCSVCHLKYDAAHHARSRVTNRMKRREEAGQLTIF